MRNSCKIMKLIRDPFQPITASVITLGNFDGVHSGHQQLITTLIAAAHTLKIPSVLLTFEPHPSEFFSPQTSVPRLMRFSEKWQRIKKWGVDYVCCLRFNKKLAELSAEMFVKNILVKQLGVKKIIVGDDFRFGAKRLGDVALLKSLGKQHDFEVTAIPQLLYEGHRISSSRVRDAVRTGDFNRVTALTAHPFCLTGRVAYGNQMGRQLGFPTANIYLHRKQVPLMGIFVVKVHGLHHTALPAVASVGYRPTFQGKKILLEVFIFDFNEIIYGKKITVEFLEKIRDELCFDHIPDLVEQIKKDVVIAEHYFKRMV